MKQLSVNSDLGVPSWDKHKVIYWMMCCNLNRACEKERSSNRHLILKIYYFFKSDDVCKMIAQNLSISYNKIRFVIDVLSILSLEYTHTNCNWL